MGSLTLKPLFIAIEKTIPNERGQKNMIWSTRSDYTSKSGRYSDRTFQTFFQTFLKY